MDNHGGQSHGGHFHCVATIPSAPFTELSPEIRPGSDRFSTQLTSRIDRIWLSWTRSSTREVVDDFLELQHRINSAISEPPSLKLGECARGVCNFCVIGLIIGWLAAMASICCGAWIIASPATILPAILMNRKVTINGYINYYWVSQPYEQFYFSGRRVWPMSDAMAVITPYIMNVLVTVILDPMCFIHATTLRWALLGEGRLVFNSNPRLLSNSKTHWPNRWYVNIISAIAITLCYGSISILTADLNVIGTLDRAVNKGNTVVSYDFNGPHHVRDVNGHGVLGLGIGLLIQAVFSTSCLISRPDLVKSWSSNSLVNTKMALDAGLLVFNKASPNRGLSLPDTAYLGAVYPMARQPPIETVLRHTRWPLHTAWSLFYGSVIWMISVFVAGAVHFKSISPAYVAKFDPHPDVSAYWQRYGTCFISFSTSTSNRDWLGLIIQCLVQAVPTFGLHCIEYLVNLTNDETDWREASSKRGARVNANVECSWDTLREWFRLPTLAFFVLKTAIQWVFGEAFNAGFSIVAMALLPAIVLTVLFLLLALFTKFLWGRTPEGTQPATYGNLLSLAHFVDIWGDRIWYGDKGEHSGVRVAGTSSTRRELQHIRLHSMYYFGFRREFG